MTDPKPLTVLDLAKPGADWRTVNPHDGTELDGRYFRAYKAKSGRIQLMPSQELLEELELELVSQELLVSVCEIFVTRAVNVLSV